ncbi:Ig-like domain-containing protein [Exiguobacterium sp. CH10]|uniref:Ig-like domain-containing protein n=1 Tax=Exiguobacterium sp. CH10 TaxID=2751261 RepID=UPI001BE57DC8|nr:Ig-like domain-containing protein [Exiguobacterium sp. CH10]
MKKWLAQLIIIILLVHSLPYSGFAMEDTEAPELISYTIDSGEYTVGDTVNVEVVAKDDLSELSYVFLYLKKPITGDAEYVSMSHQGGGVYRGTFIIEEGMESGHYVMHRIYLKDSRGNDRSIYRDAEDAQGFEVYGTTSDTTAPELVSYTIEPGEFTVGDTVNVEVVAKDDLSELSYVFLYLKKPITGDAEYVSMSHQGGGVYRGTFIIEEGMESGHYVMHRIYLKDSRGNDRSIYRDAEDTQGFEVYGTTSDTTAPELVSYTIEPGEFTVGDTVNVEVVAKDDLSELSYVFLYLKKPITGDAEYVSMSHQGGGVYRGTFTIEEGMESGHYVMHRIYLKDSRGNDRSIYRHAEDTQGFTLRYSLSDVVKPTFEKIDSGTLELDEGDLQSFTIFASDDLKLKSVDATFVNEFNETTTLSSTHVMSDGFNMELPRSAFPKEAATWKLQSLRIQDMNANETIVKEGLSFTVQTLAPITPVDARIVTFNESWSYTTVDQDVYIMPGVTLTLGQGTVLNGNVYVGGRLRLTGGVNVKGQLRGTYFTFGYYTPSQDGMVVMSGSNSVYSMTATNQLYDTLPFRLESTPVFEQDGQVSVSGSFIPLSTLYLNGEPLQTKANGTFRVELKTPEDRTLRFSMTDAYGKIHRWSYRVYKTDVPVVTATLDSGIYLKGQTVGLATTDGTIHVTRNNQAFVYEGSFTLNETVSLSAYAKDEIDRTSETVSRRYEVMTIDPVTNRDTSIQGTAEPGTHVSLTLGTDTSTVTTDETGRFVFNGLQLTNQATFSLQATHGMLTSDVWTKSIQDVIAPIVTGVSHDHFYAQPVSFTFNEGTATLNGNVVTSPVRVETDRTYELVVKDEANNQTTVRFTLDQQAPILTGVPNGLTNQIVTPTFNEGVALLNGKSFTSGQSITTDGTYTLIVRDKAGNATKQSFTIDRTAPVVSNVQNGSFNRDITPIFKEGTATLNDKPFTSGTVVSEEGVYNLEVKDKAGNVTKITFTIDKTAVEVLGVTEDGTYPSAQPTFSEGEATLNGKPFTSGQAIATDGNYTLIVTDRAGNQTVVQFTVDATPPAVSGFASGKVAYREVKPTFTEGTATLNGKPFLSGTTIATAGKYTLEITDEHGNKRSETFTIDRTSPVVTGVTHRQLTNKDLVIKFNEGTATLNGKRIANQTKVSTSGAYTLRVTDAAGNITQLTFTIDKKAPARPTLLTLTNKSTRVTGKAEKGAMVYIYYNNRTYKAKASSTGVYRYDMKTTKVGATVSVRALDAAGNLSPLASLRVLNTFRTFSVNPVRASQTYVTGKGNKGATVQAFVGTKAISKTAKVDSRGNYKLVIPRQKSGVTVTVKMKQSGYQDMKKMIKVTR